MGIREWTNNHPRVTGIVATGCALLCVAAIVYEVVASRRTYPTKPPDYFFTTDDGKSWFPDSSNQYPPFDHDGAQAVRAYVFACGGKQFVGILERFNESTKKMLAAGQPLTTGMIRYGRELKHPGDATWTQISDLATETKLEDVHCPDGSGTPTEVEPGD